MRRLTVKSVYARVILFVCTSYSQASYAVLYFIIRDACVYASGESQLKQPRCERDAVYDGELIQRKRSRSFTVKQFESEREENKNFENQKSINHEKRFSESATRHEFSLIIRKLQRETLELNCQEATLSLSPALLLRINGIVSHYAFTEIIIFLTPGLYPSGGFPVSRQISSWREHRCRNPI